MAQETVEKHGVSRRNFLKGAGAVVGAAVVGFPSLQKAMGAPPLSVTLPKDTLLEMYRRLQLIRQAAGSASGEEAAHIGVIMALNKGDVVTTTHGCNPELLGMGVDPGAVLAEAAGKATGTSGGRWMSYYSWWDPANGVLVPGSGLLATTLPHGLGAAKAAKLKGTNQVVVTTNGDGSMNETGFNASINMAQIWDLPVVFHVINNHWENHVTSDYTQSLVRAGLDLATRATGFGIPGYTVDGMDVFAVYNAASYCIDQARQGKGPSLIESVCYSYASSRGGVADQWPVNHPAGELAYWQARDPIARFESTVLALGTLTQADLDSVKAAVATVVKNAQDFAKNSPAPDPSKDEYLQYLSKVFGA